MGVVREASGKSWEFDLRLWRGCGPGGAKGERDATENKAREKRGRRSLPVVVTHNDA